MADQLAKKRKCPECSGTGCDQKPLQAPADGTFYLFPRCALCRGKGSLTEAQYRRYLSRQPSRSN